MNNATSREWPAGLPVLLGALGAVGMAMTSAAGVILGAPGPTGSTVERVVVSLAPSGTAGTVTATVALVLGLALVLGAWLTLGVMIRRGAPMRPLIGISIAWAAPLFIGPPLYSRDVYSYAADGLMVTRHLSPSSYGPAALGGSHFVAPVSGTWLFTRSPYGPLFLRIAGWTVPFAHYNLLGSVMLLRLVAVLGMVLIAVGLPVLARAIGQDAGRAYWLGVCNPLVLIHFVGGAHNDALMVGLIVVGLALAAMKHPVLGILVCILGATVKAPAALAAAFIVVETVRAMPRGRRFAALARLSGISIGSFALLTWATGLGWGWIGALGVPGENRSLLTPTTFVAHFISEVVGHDASVLSWTRNVALLLTAVGVAYFIWRAPKLGTVRACGLALALVVALGPIVLPWYALWGLIVLAAAGNGLERGYAILTSIVLLVVLEPSGAAMPDPLLMTAVVLLVGVAVAIGCGPLRRWFHKKLTVAFDNDRMAGMVSWLREISLPLAARTRTDLPPAG